MREKWETVDLKKVYETLVEAVRFFQSKAEYEHPKANFMGCVISGHQDKKHLRLFQFVDKKGREVSIELNLKEMFKNPQAYFEILMEELGKTMAHADKESRIIVPVAKDIIVA